MTNTVKQISIILICLIFIFSSSLVSALGTERASMPLDTQSGHSGRTNEIRYEEQMNLARYSRPKRGGQVIDQYLLEKMETMRTGEKLEIILQFQDTITPADTHLLSSMSISPKHIFDSFDAVFLEATREQILTLGSEKRVFYMEFNEALVYHMDMSLETVKATDTWYSIVERAGGGVDEKIDGHGVTVVVVDSGVDAGHPDLNYKEKTIMNLKSDTNFVWTESENTDTSSGHGTHCAGTVAGNGDASGGGRRGVAPGANLIGLSTGEGVAITNALGGLEWVYDNSRPYNNPHNIRLATNSWGAGGGTYSKEDIISVAINKLTFENNVVCIFAAGNSGGDGSTIQSSNYGNTPSAICVAAAERDGSGIADFSSRGQFGLNSTYPDVAAPGVKIWSTAARRTLISAMTKGNVVDPYYFAISGTSMATPHVAGLVALLWQACPSMKVSYMRDHYSGDDPDWYVRDDTRMHESELILKATADYIDPNEENGIPGNFSDGYFNKNYDISQGYGLINARRAVGLALTLQELRERDFNSDGSPDYPNASVEQALEQYLNIIKQKDINYSTSRLSASWEGEWTRFTNQSNSINNLETEQSHYVFIPQEATRLIVDLTYRAVETSTISGVNLEVVIDANIDGTIDWRSPPGSRRLSGLKHAEIDLESGELSKYRGRKWMFNIEGRGIDFTLMDIFQGSAYGEVMAEYEMGVEIEMSEKGGGITVNYVCNDSDFSPLEAVDVGNSYFPGGVVLKKGVFDLNMVTPILDIEPSNERENVFPTSLLWIILVATALLVGTAVYLKNTGKITKMTEYLSREKNK